MRSLALALVPALAATAAFAQAPAAPAPAAAPAVEVAPAKCDPKPVYPGIEAMRSEAQVTKTRETLVNYQKCMKAYIDERRAVAKANQDAMNAATLDHNTTIEKFRKDQEAAKAESEKK